VIWGGRAQCQCGYVGKMEAVDIDKPGYLDR
jgi:hypothetical protein